MPAPPLASYSCPTAVNHSFRRQPMFANGRVQGINLIPAARVNAWIKRHSVATLFVLAYGLTWLGLIPQVMAARGQVLPLSPTLAVAFSVGGGVFSPPHLLPNSRRGKNRGRGPVAG